MCRTFRWEVPARYNIAVDVVDKHDPSAPAMYWEDWQGSERTLTFGELAGLSNRIANVLAANGIGRGDRVAVLLPPLPETCATFLAAYRMGAILLSLSVLYGDDGVAHRVLVIDEGMAREIAAASDRFATVDTSPDDPAQLYYTSGTTGLAKGILHAHRYLLAHNEFEFCHDLQPGEVFHSTGEWAWIAGIVPLLAPLRYGNPVAVFSRKGGYDPAQTLHTIEKHGVRNLFATPTALRAMAALGDVAASHPGIDLRIACSAGEPLNPEVIRWFAGQFGIEVFDFYGLSESYPLCGNFPTMEVRRGSMGKPLPGWDVALLDEDEQPVPQGDAGELCLRARSNPHYPLGYWNKPEEAAEVFGGEWFHTKDVARLDEDGYVWYEGRNDDVIISAGYRIGPFEVESAMVEHPAVVEAAAVASPDALRGHIVKGFVRLAEGVEPTEALAAEIRALVRGKLSAYAYPREIEFVTDLPKTLTGKIRRIELRQSEATRKKDDEPA
jgi:acetyl-CoA synthetase